MYEKDGQKVYSAVLLARSIDGLLNNGLLPRHKRLKVNLNEGGIQEGVYGVKCGTSNHEIFG